MNAWSRWWYGVLRRAAKLGGFHVSQTPPAYVTSGGMSTASGVTVNPDTALALTPVWACVRVLAETLGSLPLVLYRRLPGGGKVRATDHPVYNLLRFMPNPEMTAIEFRETLMGHLASWGNAYAEIEYDRAGRVVALWPLRPDRTRAYRDPETGALRYEVQLPKPDSQGRTVVHLWAWQVMHVRGLGFDGINGYSPIGMERQAIGLGLATEEFGARFFGNGARPGGVLEHPGTLGDTAYERLRDEFQKRHMGLENASRVAILEEGMKYSTIGVPPEEAQFLETRRFQVREVARIFRVPPHMIGDLEQATFSNIEHQGQDFISYTMLPWFVRWELAVYRDLLLPAEREELFAEFLVDALLRGDIASRYSAYAVARQNGWMNADEIRERENLNPIPDGGGQVYLVPLNMVPVDAVAGPLGGAMGGAMESNGTRAAVLPAGPDGAVYVGELADGCGCGHAHDGQADERGNGHGTRAQRSATARNRLATAHLEIYRDVAARVLRREINDVGNAARRLLQRRDYSEFTVWLDEFYDDHQEFVARQFSPLASTYGELVTSEALEEVGSDAATEDERALWTARYLETFSQRHCGVSSGRVRSAAETAIEGGEDPLVAIEGELGTWEESRSQETARWETVRYGNALARYVFALAGVRRLRWVAFGDTCPYCSALDGTIVGIDSFFLAAGQDFEPDGAQAPLRVSSNVGHAPAHDGCDCMVVAA